MKITCEIEISDRSCSNASRQDRKVYDFVVISLCRRPGKKQKSDRAYILISHKKFSHGIKYKIFHNVEKTIVEGGKATLQLKKPTHDVIIRKANSVQLYQFLHAVDLACLGKKNCITYSEGERKSLTINRCEDYPVKSEFPRSLTILKICTCSLVQVDKRILTLQNLQFLNLSRNYIKKLPTALADLKLKELILHHNELTEFPEELSKGCLRKTLKVLDLSYNQITELSPYLCIMDQLRQLLLSYNKIRKLPYNMHYLRLLKILNVSGNRLQVLPYSMSFLNLDALNVYNNYFELQYDSDNQLRSFPILFPSLLESAASAIITHNVPFSITDVPPHLLDLLVKCCPCSSVFCGKLVFRHKVSWLYDGNLDHIASAVVPVLYTQNVRLEGYFCNFLCATRLPRSSNSSFHTKKCEKPKYGLKIV